MSELSRKRWAQKAQQLELSELDNMRSQAEQWRNGFASLTALFAAVSIAKGSSSFDQLTHTGRVFAILIVTLGFILLATGTFVAMRAAFGLAEEFLMTGENLAEWERNEARRARRELIWARRLFAAGLMAVLAATLIVWINHKSNASVDLVVAKQQVNRGEVRVSCREHAEEDMAVQSSRLMPANFVYLTG